MINNLFYYVLSMLILSGVTVSKPSINGRIVGGENATIEEFPYQVSLEIDGHHHCGGSILNSTVILTAAHCTHFIKNIETLKVRAGSTKREQGGVVRDIKRIFDHELWNDQTIDYDVSLIVLTESLPFSSSISAITLPEENEYLEAEELAVITGWGTTDANTSELPIILQKAYIPIISQKLCEEIHAKSITVTPRMICAGLYGVGGKGVCHSDSGGPLVSKNKLHGITSWSVGCAEKLYPSVFCRVTAIREWIREKVNL
ncbi:trypsin-3-like [Chrysoperla carnea]|uniref:trypsin-3-like n=1 Tax=Chrysoperla carnea TaxID=189513 RepID=UPI001D08F89F|nr:trypsin-3-like [Chrysoperla carnea]